MPMRWRAVLPLYPEKAAALARRLRVSFQLKGFSHMEEAHCLQGERRALPNTGVVGMEVCLSPFSFLPDNLGRGLPST